MLIGLARKAEGIQIRRAAGGENPLELLSEHIPPAGLYAVEPCLLAKHEPVNVQLRAHQFCLNLGLHIAQSFKRKRCHLDINSGMKQRLAAAVHFGYKLRYVLKITFCGDSLLEVVRGISLHSVFVGGVGDYPLFLRRSDVPCVDVQRDALFLAEIPQDSLFIGGSRVFPKRPHAAERVSADIIIRVEFYCGRRYHVQKILAGFGCKAVFVYFLLHSDLTFSVRLWAGETPRLPA